MFQPPKSVVLRYLVAVLSTALVTLPSIALRHLGYGSVAFFLAAVTFSAWYGGVGPGRLAVVLGGLSFDYFVLEPIYAFTPLRADDYLLLVVFLTVSFVISSIIAAQKRAERALLENRERLRLILDGALDAVASTDPQGTITYWNPQAERLFAWPRQEALGKPLADMIIPHRLPDSPLNGAAAGDPAATLNRRLETTGLRKGGAEFPVEVSLIPVRTPEVVGFSAFLRDITDRKRHEAELRRLNESLEERVRERTAWLRLLYDVTHAANEAENLAQAYRFAVRRICEDGAWAFSHVYIPDYADVLEPSSYFHVQDPARFGRLRETTASLRLEEGRGLSGRVFAAGRAEVSSDLRADFGDAVVESGVRSAVAFPVTVGRETVAIVECFSDREIEGSDHLLPLLTSVGIELGRVVERRRLQEDYAEAVWLQQRKTAHELHDGLGQELTGLGFLAKSLVEKLHDEEPRALAGKLTEGLGRALSQIRTIAKGVLPVDVDSQGLMNSLAQLAAGVEPVYGLPCRFHCPAPVLMGDPQAALHLYRIAQEAVTNAVRHARPKRVTVSLEMEKGELRLRVADDGIGLSKAEEGSPQGSGLRIMKYRAAALGGALQVGRSPEGGTEVLCVLSPAAPARGSEKGELG